LNMASPKIMLGVGTNLANSMFPLRHSMNTQ